MTKEIRSMKPPSFYIPDSDIRYSTAAVMLHEMFKAVAEDIEGCHLPSTPEGLEDLARRFKLFGDDVQGILKRVKNEKTKTLS